MRFMLDTDTCIYIIKQRPPEVIQAMINQSIDDICISTITLAELEYGVAKSLNVNQNRNALLKFLVPIAVIPFDSSAADKYGKIRAYLERKGMKIRPYDLLIAAHALSTGLTLVSNNTREFNRVPSLSTINWTQQDNQP